MKLLKQKVFTSAVLFVFRKDIQSTVKFYFFSSDGNGKNLFISKQSKRFFYLSSPFNQFHNCYRSIALSDGEFKGIFIWTMHHKRKKYMRKKSIILKRVIFYLKSCIGCVRTIFRSISKAIRHNWCLQIEEKLFRSTDIIRQSTLNCNFNLFSTAKITNNRVESIFIYCG